MGVWLLKTVVISLIVAVSLAAVEDSIVPTVEYFEEVKNLPQEKYTSRQYLEIVSALARKNERVRLATYNVLFNINDAKLDPENRWPARLPRIVALIEEMKPDILSVQELYPDQLGLLSKLQEEFAFYGREVGEINGIFYRKSRFLLVESRVWVLPSHSNIHISETVTMVRLKDVKTGKEIAVFNTHLPFSPPDTREAHARFILECMAPFVSQIPVLLTGDLNTFPNRLELQKMPFHDGDYICAILAERCLTDARNVALLGHSGPLATFSNEADDTAPFKGRGTPGVFLDHIFVSKKVQVLIHAVQSGTVEGYFPSDHFPMFIDFVVD